MVELSAEPRPSDVHDEVAQRPSGPGGDQIAVLHQVLVQVDRCHVHTARCEEAREERSAAAQVEDPLTGADVRVEDEPRDLPVEVPWIAVVVRGTWDRLVLGAAILPLPRGA